MYLVDIWPLITQNDSPSTATIIFLLLVVRATYNKSVTYGQFGLGCSR